MKKAHDKSIKAEPKKKQADLDAKSKLTGENLEKRITKGRGGTDAVAVAWRLIAEDRTGYSQGF